MRLADLEWPLLDWVRYMVAIHIVRLFAGTLFRGTPIWSAYLRLNGARVGRRVYVNSLGVSDHNLLEFGDDVVISAWRAAGGPRRHRSRQGRRAPVAGRRGGAPWRTARRPRPDRQSRRSKSNAGRGG